MSLPTPNTRKEQYLNAIATGNAGGLPTPITREEEYLDAIAKSGGGSGDGDMKKSVYDSDLDVAGAGGIKAFVNSAVAGKVDKVEGKGLSTNDYTNEDKAIVGGVTSALADKVDKVEGKGLSTNDYTDADKAIVDGVTGALAEKADTDDIPDLVSDNIAKGILGNETVLSTDTVPFVSKIMGAGKYQRKKFVGCSFVWNQLVENGDFASDTGWTATNGTLSVANNVATITATSNGAVQFYRAINQKTTGHVVLVSFDCECSQNISLSVNWGDILKTVSISPTKQRITFVATVGSGNNYFNFYATNMTANETVKYSNVILTDLTQLFGSTAIADYIYNLETATAGAGIAKLKELGFFTEDYYAYDPGSVQSVDIKEYSVTGFNVWGGLEMAESFEGKTDNYSINTINKTFTFSKKYPKSVISPLKAFKENTQYTLYITYTGGGNSSLVIRYTDDTYTQVELPNTNNITTVSVVSSANKTIKYFNVDYYATNIVTVYYERSGLIEGVNADFEPYHKTTYPLTPTELRGVPKIDANNNIYCDGDEYASDGGHTEKYDIVDLGTLEYTLYKTNGFQASISNAINVTTANMPCTIMSNGFTARDSSVALSDKEYTISSNNIYIVNASYTDPADFKTAMSGVYLVYKKATPTTETLTPFDYPQSVGSLEEITDYKVEQEDRDVAIPTGHVTEYMGKGGEFTLPTLPDTPSVLAYDGHNFFWKPETA